jgi:superfamily II DNA or RNA helicase
LKETVNLYPHQLANAKRLAFLLEKRLTACDRSETGVGKTLTALEAVRLLGLYFVICSPKNLLTHWRHWVNEMGLTAYCLLISNWEAIKLDLHPRYFTRETGWKAPPEKFVIIFDEAHRAKSHKTQNTQMVHTARRQGLPLLLLSATLVQDSLSLSGLAYPLGLVARQSYWIAFAKQYGLGINYVWGGYEDRSTGMQRQALHALLDKCGVRTRRRDIAIADCLTQADLVDAANLADIRKAYTEQEQRIRELEGLEASAAEILVERLRARQKIELLKTPLFVEAALEHLEAGSKAALFLNFNDSVAAAVDTIQSRTASGNHHRRDARPPA